MRKPFMDDLFRYALSHLFFFSFSSGSFAVYVSADGISFRPFSFAAILV